MRLLDAEGKILRAADKRFGDIRSIWNQMYLVCFCQLILWQRIIFDKVQDKKDGEERRGLGMEGEQGRLMEGGRARG